MKLLLLSLCLCSVRAQLTMKPPAIESDLPKVYYTEYNAVPNKQFLCKASGIPTPKLTWQFKKKLTDATWIQLSDTWNREMKDNGALILKEMRQYYFGVYQCKASNDKGTALSSYVFVKEAYLKLFNTISSNHVSVKQNQPVKLTCDNDPECMPEEECLTMWKKGQGTDVSVREDDRIAVDSRGDLHFLYAELSDENTNASPYYACGIWNEVLKILKIVSKTSLIVKREEYEDVNVAVVFHDNVVARETTTAVLQCIFSGKPVPTITWVDPNGNTINPSTDPRYSYGDYLIHNPSKSGNNRRRLLIRNVSPEFKGEYTCKGEQVNNTDWQYVQAKVRLTVIGPPKFKEPLKPQIKAVDTSAKFKCDAVSSDDAEIQIMTPIWFENGFEITGNMVGDASRKFSMNAGKTELSVNNLRKNYTCNIQCSVSTFYTAKNKVAGTTFADTYLVVIDKTKFLTTPESSLKLRAGEAVSFYVNATGDSQFPLTYKWTFNRTDQQDPIKQENFKPQQQILTDENRNLTIDTTNVDDYEVLNYVGEYTVVAGNPHDSVSFTVTMDLDDPPIVDPEIVASSNHTNLTVILAVVLSAVGIMTIVTVVIVLVYRQRRNPNNYISENSAENFQMGPRNASLDDDDIPENCAENFQMGPRNASLDDDDDGNDEDAALRACNPTVVVDDDETGNDFVGVVVAGNVVRNPPHRWCTLL